jgi:hypothetical protein
MSETSRGACAEGRLGVPLVAYGRALSGDFPRARLYPHSLLYPSSGGAVAHPCASAYLGVRLGQPYPGREHCADARVSCYLCGRGPLRSSPACRLILSRPGQRVIRALIKYPSV